MLDFVFYNMDCMVGMREFPDKYFDPAIVDPPYGLNITGRHRNKVGHASIVDGARAFGGAKRNAGTKKAEDKIPPGFYHPFNDGTIPDRTYFDELRRVSKAQVIWGGNFFLDYLGATSCMIVWDKARRGLSQADCEIAWTSFKGQSRVFNFKWNGMLQEDMKHKEKRIHPTQKPVKLYEWILERFAKPGDIILDTHVGSASSLIACRNTEHQYVGFEIEKYYYDIACERMEQLP